MLGVRALARITLRWRLLRGPNTLMGLGVHLLLALGSGAMVLPFLWVTLSAFKRYD